MPREKDPAGPSVFFKLKHVQRPSRAVQGENPKLVLWGIHPEHGAFGLEKRRDRRDHAYLKGCHGKGGAESREKSKDGWPKAAEKQTSVQQNRAIGALRV